MSKQLGIELAEFNKLHTQASCWIQVDTLILLWPINKLNLNTLIMKVAAVFSLSKDDNASIPKKRPLAPHMI